MTDHCQHNVFTSHCHVHRLVDASVQEQPAAGYMVDVEVWCNDCGLHLDWLLPTGAVVTPGFATRSADRIEARIPAEMGETYHEEATYEVDFDDNEDN